MQIRRAGTADLEAIGELWQEFLDFHREVDPFYTPREDGHERFTTYLRENLDGDDILILVAVEGVAPIGYCIASVRQFPPVFRTTRYGFIQDLIVTADHRRRGAGRRLYEEAARWLRARGLSRVELNVAVGNPVSQTFWQRLGFRDHTHRLAREL